MTIILNGEPREIVPPQTVGDLLAQLKLQPQRLAVELNEQLLPRGEFGRACLAEGDRVEIVTLVGGG
ncbi:MAG: sulfur carrier protein ThiS [Planctomycetaceae bacterium]